MQVTVFFSIFEQFCFFSDSTGEAPLLLQNIIMCSSHHSVLLQRILMISEWKEWQMWCLLGANSIKLEVPIRLSLKQRSRWIYVQDVPGKIKTKPDHANQYIFSPGIWLCIVLMGQVMTSPVLKKIITSLLATLWPLAFEFCNLYLCLICRINNESKNIVSLGPYFTAWNYFKPFCLWISLVIWASVVFQGMNQGI